MTKKDNNYIDLKTLLTLDQLLSKIGRVTKDSESEDSQVFTKTYEVVVNNPHPKILKIRLWGNKLTKKGTIKIRGLPYSFIAALSSYTLIQVGMLIHQTLVLPK